ncbi:HTH-type transcriptional activator Btr [compost metagenome]
MMELLRFASGSGTRQETWPESVLTAAREMERNPSRINGMDQLAEMAGLSKYHFIRQFKRHTGVTPLEFLTKVRMRQAVILLRETGLSVDEVAKELGYAGSSYFIKVFHKWVGFTPGEFRQHRGVVGMERITFD